MRIVFNQESYSQNQLTSAMIKEEVEMVGFGAELLEMIENNPDELFKSGGALDSQQSIIHEDSPDIDTLNMMR